VVREFATTNSLTGARLERNPMTHTHQTTSVTGNKYHRLHYYHKYQKLYNFLNLYNKGQVDKHLIGTMGGQKLTWSAFEIDAGNQPAIYFKTYQPDLLERLMDKCGEWFLSYRRGDGIIAFLEEQDVHTICIPGKIKKAGVLMH
jgi:hypothetical protein